MMRSINICIKYESCLRLIEEYPTGIRTKDMIYMYEATHSNVVPNDEVPESYIDASLCSVLPVDPGEPDEGDIGAKWVQWIHVNLVISCKRRKRNQMLFVLEWTNDSVYAGGYEDTVAKYF
eukprot:874340_1